MEGKWEKGGRVGRGGEGKGSKANFSRRIKEGLGVRAGEGVGVT